MAIRRFVEVIDAARRGDERAYETLYRALAPAVRGYARGHGSPDPDDVVGDVFVAVVRGIGRFDGDEAAFRAWLFTIAHHRLVDERRRRARRGEDAVDPAALARTTAHTAPDVIATSDPIVSDRLHRAVASLTDDQRDVVLLRIVADLSVATVAKMLGKEEGAVKMLQRRALAALARELDAQKVA
ncbi:MAG TPA: sigma-70 family RNA polymerase sigma factor [Acidimicrobiia bacterium]|nr:sigma-70 family RNA polymerase sigma factor [Acidimicrobiia bacterium]